MVSLLVVAACIVLASAWLWAQRATQQLPHAGLSQPITPAPTLTLKKPPASGATSADVGDPDNYEVDTPVLIGRVTEVTDGDTIHVALSSGPIIVRLHGIDTPELSQPWGRQATAALERRLRNGTEVALEVFEQRDHYDRMVAVVYLGDENVNAWMVQQGHAWAYRQYLKDAQYCAWEQQARASRSGVWSLPSTKRIAPWEYRKARRDQTKIVTGATVETEAACIASLGKRPDDVPLPKANDGPVTNTAPLDQSQPDGKCLIKGNINGKGEHIYHVPGSSSYDQTRIDPGKGERWFCTEDAALKAGWRAPRG